jgi:hypothetical protein
MMIQIGHLCVVLFIVSEILHDDCIQTDSGLVTSASSGNVVVLPQPQDICTITGFPNQVSHQEEIVYDNDLLQTNLDHEEIADSIIVNSSGSERPCKSGLDPMMELDDM